MKKINKFIDRLLTSQNDIEHNKLIAQNLQELQEMKSNESR